MLNVATRRFAILPLLTVLLLGTAAADTGEIRYSYVAGAGGVPLSVAETGDPTAPAILFIHGLGQSHLSFAAQLQSPLNQHYHLVAFDLRGHGNSGKPWDPAAYTDSKAWSDDVARVIEATGIRRPLVVAWSYGTLVINDYIRQRDAVDLAGIVMIGAVGGLAPVPPTAMDPKIMATMQRLGALGASPGLENTLLASHEVVPLLTARPMTAQWTATAETVGALVPPFARTAMGGRMRTNNADLVARIHVPMLLLGGSEDRGMAKAMLLSLSDALPLHAQVEVYEGSGHSPFAEEPQRFNADLAAFAGRVFGAR